MKLLWLKLANKVLDVALWLVNAVPTCPHRMRLVRYEARRMWRAPWVTKMVAVCIECEKELEQQRLASGGW